MTDEPELPLPEPEPDPSPHQRDEQPVVETESQMGNSPPTQFSRGELTPATPELPDIRDVLSRQLESEGIKSDVVRKPEPQAVPQKATVATPAPPLPPVDPGGLVLPEPATEDAGPTPADRVESRERRERDRRKQRLSGYDQGADGFVPSISPVTPELPPPGMAGNVRGFAGDTSGLVQVSSQILEVLGEIHKTLQEILQKDTDATFSE